MAQSSVADVIYVHGLWLNGQESVVLRRRLARALSCRIHVFHYASVAASMREIGQKLSDLVATIGPQTLHFVGHSLGGLVIYRFLEGFRLELPGRVVFLGTPSVASAAAVEAANRIAVARTMLGRCVGDELLHERPRHWRFTQPLGIIAGTRSIGLGQFIAQFQEPNDGSVAVSETLMPGAQSVLTLPVSHMGMLISAEAARQTALFLREGHFSPAPSAS
jgi:hypothetical protein